MGEGSKLHAFWHSAPGIITAIAALLTALTGTFVAVYQTGIFDPPPPPTTAGASISPQRGVLEPGGAASNESIAERPSYGATVTFESDAVSIGPLRYEFLSARLEERSSTETGLSISVRLTNNDRYPVNFWNDSFRLLVDGVPRAPTGDLNKVVQGGSADEGLVEFELPHATRTLALIVRHGDRSSVIPILR